MNVLAKLLLGFPCEAPMPVPAEAASRNAGISLSSVNIIAGEGVGDQRFVAISTSLA